MLIVESWLDSDRTWYHKLSAIVIFLYLKSIPHPFKKKEFHNGEASCGNLSLQRSK